MVTERKKIYARDTPIYKAIFNVYDKVKRRMKENTTKTPKLDDFYFQSDDKLMVR